MSEGVAGGGGCPGECRDEKVISMNESGNGNHKNYDSYFFLLKNMSDGTLLG